LDGNFVGDVAVLTNSIGLVTDQTGIDTDGQYFYTISNGDSRVRKFALDGNFLGDFLNLTDGGSPFGNNTGIAILSGIHVSIRISQVELCWNTVTNKQYQIQYRSSLTTNIWTDFGALINGTGASTCATDAVLSDQPRRYYRVVAVP